MDDINSTCASTSKDFPSNPSNYYPITINMDPILSKNAGIDFTHSNWGSDEYTDNYVNRDSSPVPALEFIALKNC
jgi:hypothetical protein